MTTSEICVISYNSRGFSSCKQDFIKMFEAITGCLTIICSQENFLLKNNEYVAKQVLPEHHLVFKPATKEGFDGRPKNGMFIALPQCFKNDVVDVSPKSNRVQSIIIKNGSVKTLLINTYFPTDPRKEDFDESELVLLLADVACVIDENSFDQIIWTGDINADFRRNSRFLNIVDEFVSTSGLEKSWEKFPVDFTHTTERNGVTHTSIIDHFFWNDAFGNYVMDAGVIHLPENQSDHCPVYCKFKLATSRKVQNDPKTPVKRSLQSWSRASEEQKDNFSKDVATALQNIDIPVHLMCRNVHCKEPSHKAAVDKVMCDVLSTLEQSAVKNMTGKRKTNHTPRVPNWNEEIEPLKENAHFWHSVWISAGKPMNCQLHEIMKRTRNRFHLLIRKKKRLLDRVKRSEMLAACLANDSSIFDAIKKKRKCKQVIPSLIDGHEKDIPEYLASKYENLYNSVDDEHNLTVLKNDLEHNIEQEDIKFVDKIDAGVLKSSARRLKPGKTDPTLKITSDFLMHAPDVVFQLLSLCLKSYMIHAHITDFLLSSMLIPIIKDKLGDITSSDNYRSIAISSLVMKLYDLVIMSLFRENLYFDDLQFGYQTDVSTSMCTWLATETISHFQRNGSEVFSCLMDMSKAFDTVQHSCLFQKLLDQGMPSVVVRFILVSYENQVANVRWNNEHSRYFQIKNGVKQGAILSAVLYCVYTNELFAKLRRLKIGCYVDNIYVGVLGYADDLLLLSPSLDGLQEMLKVCEEYANSHNLKFSTNPNPQKSKTKCMAFLQKDRELRGLILCNNKLPWVKTGKHLGMRIDNTNNIFSRDIMEKRARYIQGNNQLMQEFSFADHLTKLFVNKVYNGHHYGMVLWDLYGKEANMAYNTWSVSIRRMLRLDRKTHRHLIEPLSGMEHLKKTVFKAFMSFTRKLEASPKSAVREVYAVVKNDCRSVTGANLRNINRECVADPSRPFAEVSVQKKQFFPIPPDAEWKISLIQELIDMRDDEEDSTWSKEEVNDTLEYLCTS